MSFKIVLAGGLWLLSTVSLAGSLSGAEKDPFEKTFITNPKKVSDASFQKQLLKGVPWQNYLAAHKDWVVTFNESNSKPHRAFGKPISGIAGTNAREVALNFIQSELKEFNIPVSELKFQTSTEDKYNNVIFSQVHNGLEVLFSRMSVKMTGENSIISWCADVYDNINISITATLDAASATTSAIQRIPNVTRTSVPVLKILPVPVNKSVVHHLVYELIVRADIPGSPAKYYTLVDANTGEVLYRHNRISFNTDANVSGALYKTSLLSPTSIEPLSNLKVLVGSTAYYTDSLGNASIPGSTSQNATFSLEGRWSQVVTGSGTTAPSFSENLAVGSTAVSFTPYASIQHLSGYYHVNIVHDFMKQFFPSFTAMDNPLVTRVDVTGGACNAFYSGDDISFYATGSGCVCMAQIADVVYHEYGHGISDKFYQFNGASWDNGGMGEGYSDVWGFAITKIPKVGQGYTGSSSSYIRTYDFTNGATRKVYPDDISGESHDDGEIIAGAWYDVSLNIGSWETMAELFAKTYYDLLTAPDGQEGQLYSDILLSALQNDDNDGDLSNGTPNDMAIVNAFAVHGIGFTSDINHTEILSASSSLAISVTAELANTLPFQNTNTINAVYRTASSGSWTKVPLVKITASTYACNIPPQLPGTLIRYYIEMTDNTGQVIQVLPQEANATAPNIPYFIMVDYDSRMLETFEGTVSNWSTTVTGDNATTGKWVIAAPVASYDGATLCQPGTQHTPGGSRCAVTGNASVGAGIGTNDVDGGKTTLQSPIYDISTYNKPAVVFWRWYTNDQGATPRSCYWQVYASKDGVNYTQVERINVPDHSYRRFVFRIADLLPGATQLSLRFVAEDNIGSLVEATLDDVELLELQTITGIEQPLSLSASSISAYPNPAKELLTIHVPPSKSGSTLTIYNTIGAVVYKQQLQSAGIPNAITLPVKNLAEGMYQVVYQTEEGLSHLNVMVGR